jgi:hypothetical protein
LGSERARAAAFASLFLPAVLLSGGRAAALANDLQIPPLGNPSIDPTAVQRFRMLSDELGMSLAGTTLEPAGTVGSDGFDIGLELNVAFINPTTTINGQPYWSTTSPASAPLIVPAFHVRKGLPYSFEIGGKVMTITDSGMYAGQAEVKWGFLEGFRYLPDVSARAYMTQLFSQQDLNLTTGSADFTVGKSFGIEGLVALVPYLGWCLTGIQADTNPFWIGGLTEQQYQQGPLAQQVRYAPTKANRLGWNDNLYDRFYVGLVMHSHIVSLNVEYDFSRASAWSGASFPIRPGISTLGLRFALTL